jgi:hypothetical protein
MFGLIQIVAAVAALGVVLTLASDGFGYAVSRVVEAAFDSIEYRLALRARSRAERLKARRRGERRRAGRVRGEDYAGATA